MKTIDKILEYNFSKKEIESYIEKWIINWCGWNNSFKFDSLCKSTIPYLFGFNEEKTFDLYNDIEQICFEHDYDYWNKKWFIKSNLKMSFKLFRLFHWTSLLDRLWIAISTFLILNKYWKKFYE